VAEPLREMSTGPRVPDVTARRPHPDALVPTPAAGVPGGAADPGGFPAPRAGSSALASEPPRRAAGTRSRAGNAMARTRAGLLDGALRAVAAQGARRTTMNDIAAAAGVAKATLYNHFRTKQDVWRALVESEVGDLAADCAELPLRDALVLAATRISAHPAVRRIASTEPAVLATLLATAAPPDTTAPLGQGAAEPGGEGPAPGWVLARAAVRAQLAAAGHDSGDDLVLRWLVSHLTAPAGPDAIAAAAGCLVRGLPSGAAST
jgi:AcrR family transcriptional regulator